MRQKLWPHSSLMVLARELAGMFKKSRFKGWIAWDGDIPVGFAEAYIREFANGCESRPVAFLEGVWVKKGYRKKGIGRKLVMAVGQWAMKRGLKELGSDTQLSNKLARKSHLRWGFKETERVVYYRKALGAPSR